MSAASYWNSLYLTYFAQPKCDRALFKRVTQTKPTRIVELGIRDLPRAERTIAMAQRQTDETIHYCGIDMFEGREGGLKLKDAHHALAQTGAKVRLVPGDLMSGLSRAANMLANTDVLIIDACHAREDLELVHHFLPRMLREDTSIARYGDGSNLRWMKPSTFLSQPAKRAA